MTTEARILSDAEREERWRFIGHHLFGALIGFAEELRTDRAALQASLVSAQEALRDIEDVVALRHGEVARRVRGKLAGYRKAIVGAVLAGTAERQERTTPNEDAYFLERGADYESAIGVARLYIKQGSPSKALAALDFAVNESSRKHVAACIADGAEPDVAELIFGGQVGTWAGSAEPPAPDACPECGRTPAALEYRCEDCPQLYDAQRALWRELNGFSPAEPPAKPEEETR